MDHLDILLDRIVERVTQSHLSETEKADVFASLSLGMRRLVWPILLSHIPKETLDDLLNGKEPLPMDRYTQLITQTLKDPETPKEMYNELMDALAEVDELVSSHLPPAPNQVNP